MRLSKKVARDEAIYEVREEFEHNSTRMAGAIFELRAANADLQDATDTIASQVRTLQDEISQRGIVIADQEQEINNHSEGANQQKELIASLQHKLLHATEENLKLSKELNQSLTISRDENQRQLAYVERVQRELNQAEENLKRIEAYRKTVDRLSLENVDLHARLSRRIVWKLPLSLARQIRDKLSRRREVLALPQGN